MNDRQKAIKVKVNVNMMNLLQNSQYSLNKKHLSFAGARSQKITKLYHNRPGET